MEDNKRNYDDFFRRPDGESNNSSNDAGTSKDNGPSHYYSYGPNKSAMVQNDSQIPVQNQSVEAAQVEMTPPKPVRPYSSYGVAEKPLLDPTGGWQHEQKRRRSSFKSGFAAFMAGAVLVGGLMFASDKMNWFSGTQGILGSNSSSVGSGQWAAGTSSSNGAVKPTAFDLGGRPNNIAAIAEQSGPAVVKVETRFSDNFSATAPVEASKHRSLTPGSFSRAGWEQALFLKSPAIS
jgi:serine protease Do